MLYDGFSDCARKVMALANQEAYNFRHPCICPEHILMAILKEGTDRLLRVRLLDSHPFIPVVAIPSMNVRWVMKKRISTGVRISSDAAINRFHSVPP